MHLNIAIDTVLLDKCFVMSVPLEAPQPAHTLFDLVGQEFIEHYVGTFFKVSMLLYVLSVGEQ